MACFALLHLWAYPWSNYDLKRYPQTSSSVTGAGYQGGPFGIKAFLDAFNPWDIIKAIGRGFRWVIIGRRTREQDISYKTALDPTIVSELPASRSKKGGRYERLDNNSDEDVLLENRPYHYGGGQAAYTGYGAPRPDEADIGVQPQARLEYQAQQGYVLRPQFGGAGFAEQDTGYHGQQQGDRFHNAAAGAGAMR